MAGTRTCSTQNGLLRRSRTAKLVVQTLYKRIGDSIFKARERSELFNLKTAKRFNLKPLSDHRELLRKETLMKLEIRTWKCQKELPQLEQLETVSMLFCTCHSHLWFCLD